MLKTQAIKNFLLTQPYHFCSLYNENMEVQVNVGVNDGSIVKGVTNNVQWQGYSDGLNTWKHFRIPWNAGSDPYYEDSNITYDLSRYAEVIGMTGWDWKNKKSLWVGFDFDSLIGHKQGLSNDELEEIKNKLIQIPWISCFTSTSGTGLHIYCFINSDISVDTHNHHAAIARAILGQISVLSGLDLSAKVDAMGGNMWVWAKKAIPDKSFKIIKLGEPLAKIPSNWKDYLNVVSKRSVNKETAVDDLVAARERLILNDEHLRLIRWFEGQEVVWYYDAEKQMLVCHTYDLKRAHTELKLKGIFDTIATGKDHGHDKNCYCFPSADGGWTVRRFTRSTKEHAAWFTDSAGWTSIYFNRLPSVRIACQTLGGVESEKAYNFRTLTDAYRALTALEIEITIPPGMDGRPTTIEELKDGRVRVQFAAFEHDQITDWAKNKKGNLWEKLFFRPKVADEREIPDFLTRHVVANQASLGWFIQASTHWVEEPKSNIISAFKSKGYKSDKIEEYLGQAILHPWKLVSKPFESEYPGNREWNRDAAQLRFKPDKGKHPTWDLILYHCGFSLNEMLSDFDWAKRTGINNGYLYLQAWIASIFQCPLEPSPYLFFTGRQNTGKSIFHESLSILFTKGYIRADNALTNPSNFNGELAGAVLCVVEETNLSKKGYAYDRIKDWVTGRSITIHHKGRTPYDLPNSTHWVQCANDTEYCPIFPGDSRIVLCTVPVIKKEIPKHELLKRCEEEAPAFLYTIFNLELPEREGRLSIPVIETQEKLDAIDSNKDALVKFIEERTYDAPGFLVKFSSLYDMFVDTLAPEEKGQWSAKRVSKELPFTKGKWGSQGQLFVANVSFEPPPEVRPKIKKVKDRLITA